MPKNFCVRVKEDSIVCLSTKIDEKDTSNHQSHKSDWYFRPKDSGSALWSSWPDHKMEPSLGSFFLLPLLFCFFIFSIFFSFLLFFFLLFFSSSLFVAFAADPFLLFVSFFFFILFSFLCRENDVGEGT